MIFPKNATIMLQIIHFDEQFKHFKRDFLSTSANISCILKIFLIENVTICVIWETFTNGKQFSEEGTVKYMFATLGGYLII